MYLFEKKKPILLAALLGMILIFMPKITRLGFLSSEYLSEQARINYVIAISLVMLGFLIAYLQCNKCDKLNANKAIRAYLAFGFGMAGIYYLVNISHQGCFSLPSDIAERASIIDFIYFSFVTVTTVGYGDIVPRHTFVRLLVLIQVLFGLLLVLQASRFGKERTNYSLHPTKKLSENIGQELHGEN